MVNGKNPDGTTAYDSVGCILRTSQAACEETCDETLTGTFDTGYRGCQARTINGRICQRWTWQTPHAHSATVSTAKGTQGGHNYCRNPDNWKGGLWCYTTDPAVRWEACVPMSFGTALQKTAQQCQAVTGADSLNFC